MYPYAVWAEIDLGSIAHNVRELRRITHPAAKLMVAVKANGYGHGAEAVARTALANGATHLGVARIEEGIALRQTGIDAPILVFGYTPAQRVMELVAHDLMASIFSLDSAQAFQDRLAPGRRLVVHLKVDTGMGRLGMLPDDARDGTPNGIQGMTAVDAIQAVTTFHSLDVEGLWTHFACADDADKRYTLTQLDRFNAVADALEARGVSIPCKHTANSGAIIDLPQSHMGMVRAGISVYGLYPSTEVNTSRIDLKPAMTLKARVVHVKQVPAGTPISYGGTWQAPQDTTIATIPVGYGDGYCRGLSNIGAMLVRGQKAPIVGRVCMDLTMIDVGHIPDVCLGDEVVLVGRQHDACISADEVAALTGTINYEVTTRLTDRVSRIYIDGTAT